MATWRENAIIGKILFVAYAVVSCIMLLNMLIAMMGNTYTMIEEDKQVWPRHTNNGPRAQKLCFYYVNP